MKINNFLLLLILPLSIIAQNETTWKFPYNLENGGLKKFNTYHAKVEACQVPPDILKKISTPQLIKTCLNYPLFPTMTFHNSYFTGFNQVANEFNGFKELFSRENAGNELLKEYKSLKIENLQSKNTILEREIFIHRIFFLEFLLSEKSTLENFSKKEIRYLLTECVQKLSQKRKYRIHLDKRLSTLFLMSRIMEIRNFKQHQSKKESDPNYLSFLKTSCILKKDIVNDIHYLSLQFLNQE